MNFKLLIALTVALGMWLSAPSARAQLLMTIDVSNPNLIVFTATGNPASASSSSISYGFGIDLTNFLTFAVTPLSADVTVGSDLKPTLNTNSYFGIFVDDLSGSSRDINLFSNFFSTIQNFQAGTAAFSGSLQWDTSDANHAEIRSALPSIGATGNLYVGASIGPTPVLIGTWQVIGSPVPEPSSIALALGGLLVLAISLRRRTRS